MSPNRREFLTSSLAASAFLRLDGEEGALPPRPSQGVQAVQEAQPELIVAEGMDTIDASLVDTSLLGHSYIGDVQSIVSDLHDLVMHGTRPMARLGLETLQRGDLPYWTIKPQLETAAESSLHR